VTQAQPQIIDGLGQPHGDPKPGGASLPLLQLEKSTYGRALDCVHCGLCLPACPTYTDNGLEADSPRGRIYLIKGLADGKIDPTDSVMNHLDLCLDCRACETACPSAVVYHELIEETRAKLSDLRKPTLVGTFVRWLMFNVFAYPTRLKAALIAPRLLQRIRLWSPLLRLSSRIPGIEQLNKMQQMLPEQGALWEEDLEPFYPADVPDGKSKATVAFFAGCVGSVLFQQVNRQTIQLLQRAGCDVIVPIDQQCCGAIHHHEGQTEQARRFAASNIDAFTDRADYIVNNIAGCGAMLKEYVHVLQDDGCHGEDHAGEKASAFVAKVRDISELLVELSPPAPTHAIRRTVTYHDACHLAHAQKVTAPPRQLLESIEGLTIVPLFESDMCCGAAGTYNLTQPQMARHLAERKIQAIEKTGARICVTGNVGCAMQIQSEARRLNVDLKIIHPVTLLHEACFGPQNK